MILTQTRRDTLSPYHYSETIDASYTVESRLEFQQKLGAHALKYGATARSISAKDWADFFFEPVAVWDITRDRNYIDATNSVNWGALCIGAGSGLSGPHGIDLGGIRLSMYVGYGRGSQSG